jgi:hypothetical protein
MPTSKMSAAAQVTVLIRAHWQQIAWLFLPTVIIIFLQATLAEAAATPAVIILRQEAIAVLIITKLVRFRLYLQLCIRKIHAAAALIIIRQLLQQGLPLLTPVNHVYHVPPLVLITQRVIVPAAASIKHREAAIQMHAHRAPPALRHLPDMQIMIALTVLSIKHQEQGIQHPAQNA